MGVGTFITEWDQGSAICEKIFSSKNEVEFIVKKLIDLTIFYNFDGWLINIENPLNEELVKNVEYFLRKLRSGLKLTGNPVSQVIWYDSVTKAGKLMWQNELNHQNR